MPKEYEDLIPAEATAIDNDLMWSYRVGETKDSFVKIDPKPGATVRISAPETGEQPYFYEFVFTLTSPWYGINLPPSFKRVA